MTEEEWDSPDWWEKLPAWVREDRPMTEAEWLSGPHLYHRIDSLEKQSDNERRLRLFACACCRRVWDLLPVDAARRIVELSEAYADGRTTADELRTAKDSPDFVELDAVCNESGTDAQLSACVVSALLATRCLASTDLSNDMTFIVQGTSHERTHDFIRTARDYQIGRSPGPDEVEYAEKEKLLFDIFGNPFRPVAFSAEWRTDTAVALARQMYEAREFGAMPILADALQDAGCDNPDILDHCRGGGTHVRGCWVCDLVLGKS